MFNHTTSGYSLSDIAAVTGNNNRNSSWGDGEWWIILIFLFAFGGWGRGGAFGGGNGGDGAGYPCASALDVRSAVDQQTLISKLDNQTYGLADSNYALNSAIMSGFHGVDNALCTLGYQTQAGINSINVANMQNTNAIQTQLANCCCGLERQLADCCCENRAAIADIKYTMATNNCALQNTMANNTRDIIDAQRENTRSILDFLVSDKLSTLQTENQNLKLKASQAEQNNYLINALRPTPNPAFSVPAPYNFYGCNAGCGNY